MIRNKESLNSGQRRLVRRRVRRRNIESNLEPNFVAEWRAALLNIERDNDSPESRETFDRIFKDTPSRPFTNVTQKLFRTAQDSRSLIANEQTPLTPDQQIKINQKAAELETIQFFIAKKINEKAGTFSLRRLLYKFVGLGLAGLATTQIFPTDPIEGASATYNFFQQYNLLFSNLLFVSCTFLTRVFIGRSDKIANGIKKAETNYQDLEKYLKEACADDLLDTTNSSRYTFKKDFEDISNIVTESWYRFLGILNVSDITKINSFRVADASTNMIKALVTYLIFAKKNKQDHVFTENFIEKLKMEFSSLLYDNYRKQNTFQKILNFQLPGHLGFHKMPSFLQFSRGISKVANRTFNWTRDRADQELKNDRFIADFSNVAQLRNNFSTFKPFYEVESSNDLTQLLKDIGVSIQKRVGSKSSSLASFILGSCSSLLAGLPYFSYVYQRTDIFGPVGYFLTPLSYAFAYLFETMNSSLADSEKKYHELYDDYEHNLTKLIDENIINIGNFETSTLAESHLTSTEEFKRVMSIIARTLTVIDIDRYSEKERVYITLKLFNALTDQLIDKIPLPQETNDLIICNNLAGYIESLTSRNWIGSLYRNSPARKHLKSELDENEILSYVATSHEQQKQPNKDDVRRKSALEFVRARNMDIAGSRV